MIEQLPNWINVLFLVTWVSTLIFYYYANNRALKTTLIILLGSIIQSILAYSGFYNNSMSFPPRYVLLLVPPVIFIVYALNFKKDVILKNRKLEISTLSHLVRIPVEICLLFLFFHKMIPELMTFEGRNFDIVAGITALPMAFALSKNKLKINFLIIWNIICLCLVVFIAINGILSAESVLQQFAFDQANKAINYFPFILLPGIIVPIVIYTHLTDLLKLYSLKHKSV